AAFEPGLSQAAQIAARTGARLIVPLFLPRLSKGAGRPICEQLPYPVEMAGEVLKDARHIVLLGATRPVNFFAYPGKPSTPEPPGCEIFELCTAEMDVPAALESLLEATGAAQTEPPRHALDLPDLPTGPLTLTGVGQALAHLMPEDTIIGNESVTAGAELLPPLQTARPHELLITTGGAIGCGLPLVVGAAVACPERQVISLTGDGSAMYTPQSLWTMAREQLNILVIVIANRGYQILRGEMAALGVENYGRNAQAMFDIETPELDWVALAKGHGVPGERVSETNEDAVAAIRRGLAQNGPYLIEIAVG
ncbi:MAG: acetolactate synthase large subunit, partial [Pseudomonadota bacterium]